MGDVEFLRGELLTMARDCMLYAGDEDERGRAATVINLAQYMTRENDFYALQGFMEMGLYNLNDDDQDRVLDFMDRWRGKVRKTRQFP
jgi:hypothetical protein